MFAHSKQLSLSFSANYSRDKNSQSSFQKAPNRENEIRKSERMIFWISFQNKRTFCNPESSGEAFCWWRPFINEIINYFPSILAWWKAWKQQMSRRMFNWKIFQNFLRALVEQIFERYTTFRLSLFARAVCGKVNWFSIYGNLINLAVWEAPRFQQSFAVPNRNFQAQSFMAFNKFSVWNCSARIVRLLSGLFIVSEWSPQ